MWDEEEDEMCNSTGNEESGNVGSVKDNSNNSANKNSGSVRKTFSESANLRPAKEKPKKDKR